MYSVKLQKYPHFFIRTIQALSCLFYKKTPETLVFYSSWVKIALFLEQISIILERASY